jgi:hypothetical protein
VKSLRRVAFILTAFACASHAEAQTSASSLPVPPGARVRVTAPLIANYLEMRGDTVVLVEDRAGKGLWSIPYNEIRTLHLAAGQRRNYAPYIARGAVIGGVGGFGLGVLAAATFQPSDTSKKFKRVTTGLVVGGIGAIIGGVVGSRYSVEHWSPINLPRRLSLVPTRRGAELRVEFLF